MEIDRPICLNCGKTLGGGRGYWIKGERFVKELPKNPAVCDFQCLTEWDATGNGLKGNQGFNLDKVELSLVE